MIVFLFVSKISKSHLVEWRWAMQIGSHFANYRGGWHNNKTSCGANLVNGEQLHERPSWRWTQSHDSIAKRLQLRRSWCGLARVVDRVHNWWLAFRSYTRLDSSWLDEFARKESGRNRYAQQNRIDDRNQSRPGQSKTCQVVSLSILNEIIWNVPVRYSITAAFTALANHLRSSCSCNSIPHLTKKKPNKKRTKCTHKPKAKK